VSETQVAHGLGRAEFIALLSTITGTIAISIDTVLPAFDEIEAEFELADGGGSVSLTITVFLAAMAFGMLTWGPLSDRFGRRTIMYASLSLFVVGAVVATTATSFTMFLIGRAIWGVAAAGPRAVGIAIVRDSYEGDLMARIMSLASAVFLIVPIVAPTLGEGLLVIGSWRLTTAVSVVLGLVVAVWFLRIRETLNPDNVVRLDVGELARTAKTVVTNRTTMLFTLATTMTYSAFFPWLGSSIQMIGEIYDRPEQFALLFGANAAVMAVVILITERLIKRFGAYIVLLVELSIGVLVALVYVIWAVGSDGVISFVPWIILVSAMVALSAGTAPMSQTLSMQPMGRIAGTAASITGAIIFAVGATLGAVTDSLIDDTITPFGVGFLVYGSIAVVAIVLARPKPTSKRVSGNVVPVVQARAREVTERP